MKDMKDIMLSEQGALQGFHKDGSQSEDASEEDYYSGQAGDDISSKTQVKDRRRTYIGLTLLFCGFILVGIGVAVHSARNRTTNNNNEDDSSSLETQNNDNDFPIRQPLNPRGPNRSPTKAPVEAPTEAPTTANPTKAPPTPRTAPPVKPLTELVEEWLGPDALSNETSIAFQAYTWLNGNTKLDSYSSFVLRQRFTAAALHLATNINDSWIATGHWMTNKHECKWHGIECEDNFLIAFNLTKNGLAGLIPNEITLVSDTLMTLDLSYNDLGNAHEELSWLAKLTNLQALDVHSTKFQADGIPSYLGKLTDMRLLDISYNQFVGPIDGTIFEPMQELLYLEMGGNSYNSIFPASIASLPKLEALYLEECDLQGDLSFILDLDSAFEVWVDNNDLTGSIPTEIGDHTKLKSLSMSDNALTGAIPSEIGLLLDMEQMWLLGNFFAGEIPSEIGGLEKLKIFQVENNDLTGDMPDEICALRGEIPGLLTLGSDCIDSDEVICDCCTCCKAPCPIVSGGDI